MKILVFSDSHASLGFMRKSIEALRPDQVIHLGDHYDDAETIAEESPSIPFCMVAGNCDRYRCLPDTPTMRLITLDGLRFLVTHGHMHQVKSGIDFLLADARKVGANAVLFGHTHQPLCYRAQDGLWVMNPGSCSYGGSVGYITTNCGQIEKFEVIKEYQLEDML